MGSFEMLALDCLIMCCLIQCLSMKYIWSYIYETYFSNLCDDSQSHIDELGCIYLHLSCSSVLGAAWLMASTILFTKLNILIILFCYYTYWAGRIYSTNKMLLLPAVKNSMKRMSISQYKNVVLRLLKNDFKPS